jgi:hypothetical protein
MRDEKKSLEGVRPDSADEKLKSLKQYRRA